MKKHELYLILLALLAFGPMAWAQTPAPSTALEPLSLEVSGKKLYKFNYPSISATGDSVVLSSLLMCWAPESPQSGDSIESVHIVSHYTITANSQCPTNYTDNSIDLFALSALCGGYSGESFKSVVTRSIVIMPDYEGYGVSSDRTHPYLAEAATAQQVVDAVTYGLALYDNLNGANNTLPLKKNWRSFSIGYSQGGAVALAVQRHIEQNDLSEQLHFRGTLCGDGPYDLIATLRYYLEDDGDSYGVETIHGAGQATLPVVLPMILKGMIDSDPTMANHTLGEYLTESFLATGIMDWLASKNMSNGLGDDKINTAWLQQLNSGSTVVNGTTYDAPNNMGEMFFVQTVPGMLGSTLTVAWANLDKILAPGFYNYLSDPDNFNSVPAVTGNPYQDMHHALAANNVIDWVPKHRIQFVHSKYDMVVPYGNYLAFQEAHPDGENDLYRVDANGTNDHQLAGTNFMIQLTVGYLDDFEWIDTFYSLEGEGTEESPYLISSTEDWDYLAEKVSSGESYSGKYFQLTDDISVTTMVGTSSSKFSGTFDGNGHTLTFNQTSTEQYIAPFRYIKGATIKNLTVSGNVSSSNKFAGGVVAHATAAGNTITNCVNSTIINATISGNGSHGGILGQLGGTGGVTISGCVFNGKMLGANTDYWCGIMGYTGNGNYSSVTISDCLFNPEEINVKAVKENYTICRPGPAVNNSYYNTEAAEMSQKQGKQAYSITGNTDVTVANVGTATNYTVSGITSYGTGIKYNDVLYAGDGDNVSLNLSYTGNNNIIGYTVNYGTLIGTAHSGTNDPYTLAMTANNTIVSERIDSDHIAQIASVEDWNTFCNSVNDGINYNGYTVKLMNDVGPVINMAGTSDHPFIGIFDGQGNTLTFNANTSDSYCAPFRYANGATFQNLKVDGTITTSNQFAAGFVGQVKNGGNGCAFTNCESSINIVATRNGDGTHGGFVANIAGGTNHFTGCAFTGSITTTNGTTNCGGFAGWCETDHGAKIFLTDCLFAPSTTSNLPSGSKTFFRIRNVTETYSGLTNCYYTYNLGDPQGKKAYSITGDEDVTVEFAGTATTYNVSGIAVYGKGITHNNVLYAGKNEDVSLNLSYTGSHSFRGYVTDYGTLSGEENPYTLTMPENNVMISSESNCPPPTGLTVSNLGTNEATVSWIGYGESYNLRYRSSNEAIITLIAGDVWEDGSGYQMLLDADATAFGTIIPEEGGLNSSGDVAYEVYDAFEYKIPENADGSLNTQNMVFNNSVTIQIPAGTYDWCITNPTPNERVYIASNNGNINGRYDDFVFEAGKTYVFTVSYCSECSGGADRVDLTINGQQISRDASEWTVVNNVTTPSYTITNLNDDVSYEVQVQAFCENENEYSNWSSSAFFKTPSVCAIPVNLASNTLTATSATLGWEGIQSTYNIRYKSYPHVFFYEDFENGFPENWTIIDADGDEMNWKYLNPATISTHSGSGMFCSESYVNYVGAYDPDNWLITPQLDLQGVMKVWIASQDVSDLDHFAIYLSTTGNTVADFLDNGTVLVNETIAPTGFTEITADLSDYAGQQGYIAIRHFNSYNKFILKVDDFGIYESTEPSEWFAANNIGNNTFVLNNLMPETDYEWQVQGINSQCEGGLTEWSQSSFFTTEKLSVFTKNIVGYGTGDGRWYLIASPIAADVAPSAVGNLVAEDTRDFDLYRFNQAAEKEWENYKQEGDHYHFDLESGHGYLYANKDDVTLTFTGTLYDDDGTIDLEYSTANLNEGMHGWNLIGNPFATEATIDQPFIRMNESGTALTVQVEAGNTVAAMEGVFVQATAANQTASFTTVNRGRDGGKGMIPMLNISLSHDRGEVLANAIVRLDGGQTLGSLSFREDDSKFYIPQNGKDYAIVSVGNVGEMPLNFKANENGQYTISVNPENVEMSYLHLIDNRTGADVDLLAQSVPEPVEGPNASGTGPSTSSGTSYTFNANVTDYESRFRLVFVADEAVCEPRDAFAFISDGNIIVNGEGTLQVIDVMGRVIVSGDAMNRVSTGGMAPGVYVLRLINGNDVKVQKIVVR